VTDSELTGGALYPRIRALRRVSARIAVAVARQARDSGTGRPLTDDVIARAVTEAQRNPAYRSIA